MKLLIGVITFSQANGSGLWNVHTNNRCNLCTIINWSHHIDDQLATLAVQGILPTWREKLLGQEFDNLD